MIGMNPTMTLPAIAANAAGHRREFPSGEFPSGEFIGGPRRELFENLPRF
jgi:hypothetical protein